MSNTKMVELGAVTMSSLNLLDVINNVRIEFNEPEVENSHFLKRIEDELDGELGLRKVFLNPAGGRPKGYYDLTIEQCTLVGMRESKGVRRAVLGKIKELENQITQPKLSENCIKDLVESEVKKQLAKKTASRKKKKTDAIDFSDAAIVANKALASKGEGRPLFDFITALSLVLPRELVCASIKDMGLIDDNWGLPQECAIFKGLMYFTTRNTWLGWGKGHLVSNCVFITPKGQDQIMDILRK